MNEKDSLSGIAVAICGGTEKGGHGRSAVAITLLKRWGEISEWSCQWASGGIELYQTISTLVDKGALTAKFPHRVCQLLDSYLTIRSGISNQADDSDFPIRETVLKEVYHAESAAESAAELMKPLETCLCSLGSDPQTCLKAIIGLCTPQIAALP